MKIWYQIQLIGMVMGTLLIASLFFELFMIIYLLLWLFVMGIIQYPASLIMIFKSGKKSMFKLHGIASTVYLILIISAGLVFGIGESFYLVLIPAYFLAIYYTYRCQKIVTVMKTRKASRLYRFPISNDFNMTGEKDA